MSHLSLQDGHSTAQTRVRRLRRDLFLAEQHLDSIDEGLRSRVEVRVRTRISTLGATVDDLLAGARDGRAAPEVWAELHALSYEVEVQLDECLLLLGGAAARAAGLDAGYCSVADALVDELVARTPVGHWSSFTVPGRSETYVRSSRVIAVRFPATSVWDLPVVAHELGHFVGPALVQDAGLGTEHPLDLLFEQLGDGEEESWSHLQELFADAFAAHVLGPAYGFTCVFTSFDPLLAIVPTDTHPATSDRVHVITGVLRRAGSDSATWAADALAEAWAQLVGSCGVDATSTPSACVAPIVELVLRQLPVSGYTDWAAAESAAQTLLGPVPQAPQPRRPLRDILNGAWLARLRATSTAAADDVGNRSLAWCRTTLPEVA